MSNFYRYFSLFYCNCGNAIENSQCNAHDAAQYDKQAEKTGRNLEKFFKGFLNFYKIKQRKRIELIKLKILEIFPSALQTSAQNEYTLCKDIKIIANLLNLVPLY